MAFGTGRHETTKGCLLAVAKLAKTRKFKKPLDDKHWRDAGDYVEDEELDTPFVARRFTTEDIIRVSPSFGPFYEKKKRNMTAAAWRQNYECLPNEEGVGRVFPRIVPVAEPSYKMTPWMEFGIDVGRTKDATVITAWECQGDVANYVSGASWTGRDFYTQAKQIAKWIDQYSFLPRNVKVEANSLGFGLIDALERAKDVDIRVHKQVKSGVLVQTESGVVDVEQARRLLGDRREEHVPRDERVDPGGDLEQSPEPPRGVGAGPCHRRAGEWVTVARPPGAVS